MTEFRRVLFRSVTLSDLAALVGVTKVTVSRALNTPELVSVDTLERIREAVRQTGYTPDLIAGSLASTRSDLIVALIPAMGGSVFQETVEALTSELAASGYQLLIGHCRESLHCGIPCEDEERHHHPAQPALPQQGYAPPQTGYGSPQPGNAPPQPTAEDFCLAPMLTFPICNDPYYASIADLYKTEKKELDTLTDLVNDLTKEQVSLTAIQQSLVKALKEVTPS